MMLTSLALTEWCNILRWPWESEDGGAMKMVGSTSALLCDAISAGSGELPRGAGS